MTLYIPQIKYPRKISRNLDRRHSIQKFISPSIYQRQKYCCEENSQYPRHAVPLLRWHLWYFDTHRKHPQTYSRAKVYRALFYERPVTSRKSFQRDEILSRLESSSRTAWQEGKVRKGRARIIQQQRKEGNVSGKNGSLAFHGPLSTWSRSAVSASTRERTRVNAPHVSTYTIYSCVIASRDHPRDHPRSRHARAL